MSVDIFGSVDDDVVVVSVDSHFDVSHDDDDDDVVDANIKILDKVVGVVVVVVKVGANDKILASVVVGADGVAFDDVRVAAVGVAVGNDRTIFLTSLAIRSTASIRAKTLSASRRPLSRAPNI